MRLSPLIKLVVALICTALLSVSAAYADVSVRSEPVSMDRIQMVNEQINLLSARLIQSRHELTDLQQQHDHDISELTLSKASKNLLDKAALDISVSTSNLDSIKIELTDVLQTISWLEKNTQELESQLNVLNIFGLKIARSEVSNVQSLRSDLGYQKQMLSLERKRLSLLQSLQGVAKNTQALKKDKYSRLNVMLKSRKMLYLKQQQMRDELAYQQEQNEWLQQLNKLYDQLAKTDPVNNRAAYTDLERGIFFTNERASYAYFQSLIARYQDQMQQMNVAVTRGTIGVLNEMSDQLQALTKQISRLQAALKSRQEVIQKHIYYLKPRVDKAPELSDYVAKLSALNTQYQESVTALDGLSKKSVGFRVTLDKALQDELAQRQGIFSFGPKMLLDLGKELLLVPTLTFQVFKSLTLQVGQAFRGTSWLIWGFFILTELVVAFTFSLLNKLLILLLDRPLTWGNEISAKWLLLQWLRRHFLDLFLIGNLIGVFALFGVPLQNYLVIIYLSVVWLSVKSILTVARLCLVETTHDASGHDVRLYRRLRWMILIGAVITAITVFMHQLPLVYEIKALCDWLFMLVVMIASILLLKSWSVIPNLIISQLETSSSYFEKSIRLICILIPLLMLANSLLGLMGFVNLITTVTWYELVFMGVLIGYLILRGLLSDGLELLSRVMIQYVHNGWLWSEAFLKPLDKVLRITLFLSAGALLFLIYGWDAQSPIVERLKGLLHYKMASVLNTAITPFNVIELFVVISVFYWTAKWTREFVYRLLVSQTPDMGVRNSIAILSQYCVIILGAVIGLRVLGIDLIALTAVVGVFAVAMGWGLKDLVNNFVCGFLILVERPLRVGDIVNINEIEGEVTHVGGRAVTIRTWDYMDHVVPNTDIYNKAFTNWTAKDNTVRTVVPIKISRHQQGNQYTN